MSRATTLRFCVGCGAAFEVRQNEVNRGWGLYCSRSCKTTTQNRSIADDASSQAEKVRANGLVNMRVRRGTLAKPLVCSECGRPKRLDAHHDDYGQPDVVVWICRSCHMKRHWQRVKQLAAV